MSPKPSRLVALVASLALAGSSSIGTINGQRRSIVHFLLPAGLPLCA